MKRLVLLLVAGTAAAQPATEPSLYVAPGVALGGDGANDGVFVAGTLEGGARLSQAWWGFAGIVGGKSVGGNWGAGNTFTGTNAQLRLGLEWHHRWLRLGFGGAFAHEHVQDRPDLSYNGAALVMRAGLDVQVGNEHVRFRPATEFLGGGRLATPAGKPVKDYECIGVYAAVAYEW